jgi:hypothetical protein
MWAAARQNARWDGSPCIESTGRGASVIDPYYAESA